VDQPEIALLDQIAERGAAPDISLGDADHQPQVVLDHGLARSEIAGPRPRGHVELLLGGEQRLDTDLVEVGLQRADPRFLVDGADRQWRTENGFRFRGGRFGDAVFT
jgi:hypothetical protein